MQNIDMNNKNEAKIELDRKIQQNNVNIEQYKYYEHENAYCRFDDGFYSSAYKLRLDRKGYLIETYSSDEQGFLDSNNITVYNNGKEYSFSTMDDSYDYECINGKLYYVGYMNENVYGSIYGESDNYEGKFSIRLYEDMARDIFEQKKSDILNDFFEQHKKKTIAELNQSRELSTPKLSVEQKEATQKISSSKYDLPKYEQSQSIIDIREQLKDKMNSIYTNEKDLKQFCDMWSNNSNIRYSTLNRAYFLQQQKENGYAPIKFIDSGSNIKKNGMSLSPDTIKNNKGYVVLIPITIAQRYNNDINKFYNDVINTLDKNENNTFPLGSTAIHIYKTGDSYSAFDQSENQYLFKDIDKKDLRVALNKLKTTAIAYRTSKVYDVVNDAILNRSEFGIDSNLEALHTVFPGQINDKEPEKLERLNDILNSIYQKWKIEVPKNEKINIRTVSAKVDRLIDERVSENIWKGATAFQTDIAKYVLKRNLGIDAAFEIKIPEEYKGQSLRMEEQEKILDSICTEIKSFKHEYKRELHQRGLHNDLVPPKKITSQMKNKVISDFEKSNKTTIQLAEFNYKMIIDSLNIENSENLIYKLTEYSHHFGALSFKLQKITENISQLRDTSYNKFIELCEEGYGTIRKMDAYSERTLEKLKEITQIQGDKIINKNLAKEQEFKEAYRSDPYMTLLKLKEDKELLLENASKNDLAYIANSQYIKQAYSNTLNQGKDKFLNKAVHRSQQAKEIQSKNGVFVEVVFCENILSKPYFHDGELLNIKDFNVLFKEYNSAIKKAKIDYEKKNIEIPQAECKITIFAPSLEQTTETKAYYKIGATDIIAKNYSFEIAGGNKQFKQLLSNRLLEELENTPETKKEDLKQFIRSIDKAFRERTKSQQTMEKTNNIDKNNHNKIKAAKKIEHIER